MSQLNDKDKRKLLLAATSLFAVKSLLVPKSFAEIPIEHFFARELRLKSNRRAYLTDSGYAHFRTVVDILDGANVFDGVAGYSDIWDAWRKVVEEWLSNGLGPENADEVIQAIADLVAEEVDDHTFLVPLFGIEIDGVDSFELGAMSILRMSPDVLDSAGVVHSHADVSYILKLNENFLWLKGSARGTRRVARKRFTEQANLTVGVLAITSASMYEGGASNFRIGIVMTPEETMGRAVWFSWHESDRNLTTHFALPHGQRLPVKSALGAESDMVRGLYRLFEILRSDNRTQLEEAIVRAVYWFSDAHRDPVLVMKLVKYWSCVEAFFSFENEQITHAVSAGLASILVSGGFQFVPSSEYNALKKRIIDLYKLRSGAVHRGSHQHTTDQDVAQFSQWIAWMIVSMVVLAERGYTTLMQVKAQTDRLDGMQKQPSTK